MRQKILEGASSNPLKYATGQGLRTAVQNSAFFAKTILREKM